MKFPAIGDIASTSIISINIEESVLSAMELMLEHEHRNIVVVNKNTFYIFTILDVLNIQNLEIALESSLSVLNLSKIPTINRDRNVLDTLSYLNNEIEFICVLDRDNSLYGLVTHSDITLNIDPDTLMDNFRLADFLKIGRQMKCVNKEEKTSKILNEMIHNSFDNVVVVEDLKPLGILTTKDIMCLIKGKSDLSLSIETYMSAPVDSIHKNASIKEALSFITKKHYKRVIVVDDKGKLSGIVTQKELISLTYSRWAVLMQEYQKELSEINNMLEHKNKEYETMASTDSLTGLYNRHKFTELYVTSYKSMLQRESELSLIMLDIDFFKRVNDTYGHNIGDDVLVQISHSLLKVLRNVDIVCRWGGEEFVVLLPSTSLETATILAEKIRLYIKELELDRVGSISVSLGVCSIHSGEKLEESIDRADKALYLAKHSGRDCVKTELEI